MTCCGDKIKQVASIVKGNINLAVDTIAAKVFNLPMERYHNAEVRKAICRKCEKHTWLTAAEYLAFLNDNKIEVIKNIEDLTVLPELPKQEYRKGMKLFCMLCKCWLPAKAELKTEQCPINKWET